MDATIPGDPAGDGTDPGAGNEVRRHRLLALLALTDLPDGGGSGGDDAPTSGLQGQLERLCALSVSEVGVSGAGITVMSSLEAGQVGYRDQLCSTGALTRRLEDLQLTAGEGPCLDAYREGAPVLAGDLAAETPRWLGFGPEAIAAGAAAVFSLPLQIGAVRLGTFDLVRDTLGTLDREQLADALILAGLVTETLLELVGDRDPTPGPGAGGDPGGEGTGGTAGLLSETMGWLPDVHAQVHQASGMVSVQEGIGVGEALLRIRAHAFAQSVPIEQVARWIIDRDLVLPRDGDGTDEGPTPSGRERKT